MAEDEKSKKEKEYERDIEDRIGPEGKLHTHRTPHDSGSLALQN